MPTLVCVPIMVQDEMSASADARAAKDAGADLVEFRVDELFSGNEGEPGSDSAETRTILRIVAACPLPCIVTCRAADEGGAYDGDEPARVSLYERLGAAGGRRLGPDLSEHPPTYLDFEWSHYARSENIAQKINLAVDHPGQVRRLSTGLILSTHDFSGRPADLSRRVLRMRDEPAAKVLKIAYRARTLRDNLELFDLLAERDRPTIALAMGEFGLASRVLAPKFGGFLTFAALRAGAGTAPGQPTVRELLDLYRFRRIGPRTRVYGVVGWPVAHSKSPLVHNAAFDAAGFDAVYLPLPIPAAESDNDSYLAFKATLGELIDHPNLDLSGCSVTIPHKESLVRLAHERGWALDEVSDACGAANTLVVERTAEGAVASARVLNTDAAAAADPIADRLGGLDGMRVAVVGAGGAARAIVFELARRGARVVVYNRSPDRARELADTIAGPLAGRGQVVPMALDAIADSCCEAFVNCTPVGMRGGPAPDQSPIPVAEIARAGRCGSSPVVLDTVYNPVRTPLVIAAEAHGWRTIDGVEMFVRQAERQSHGWTGRWAPRGMMDTLVRAALGEAGSA